MKYDNQLRYADHIVSEYDGSIPLSHWLKQFFKKNKQMGSRDRKTVAELVYGYYRLGHLNYSSVEKRLLDGAVSGGRLPELVDHFKIDSPSINAEALFPFADHLSSGIDRNLFARSFLIQPDLFLRIRPFKTGTVLKKLDEAGVVYERTDDCIRLSNSVNIDSILELDSEVVIQDRSSQKCGELISSEKAAVWDCCAGSGGKSIMAFDRISNIELTVSDNRSSIISNLKSRFAKAGIKNYDYFLADLTGTLVRIPEKKYDLIIADLPCTGSGTWARTPEQLFFFKPEKIEQYAQLQQKILTRAIHSIKSGGALLYITCSVFKKENEEIAEFVSGKLGLKLEKMELMKGYAEKADSMFAALFSN